MPTFQATDDFNRADANPISGSWVNESGLDPMQIVGNEVRSTTTGGGGDHSLWALVVNEQQMSTVTAVTLALGHQVRAVARGSTTATTNYFCSVHGPFSGTTVTLLEKYVAGAYSIIASGSTVSLSTGGTISCDCDATTTIRMLVNGAQVYSVTDTSIANGRMGVGGYADTAVSSSELDNWQGDYFFATAGPTDTSINSYINSWV